MASLANNVANAGTAGYRAEGSTTDADTRRAMLEDARRAAREVLAPQFAEVVGSQRGTPAAQRPRRQRQETRRG